MLLTKSDPFVINYWSDKTAPFEHSSHFCSCVFNYFKRRHLIILKGTVQRVTLVACKLVEDANFSNAARSAFYFSRSLEDSSDLKWRVPCLSRIKLPAAAIYNCEFTPLQTPRYGALNVPPLTSNNTRPEWRRKERRRRKKKKPKLMLNAIFLPRNLKQSHLQHSTDSINYAVWKLRRNSPKQTRPRGRFSGRENHEKPCFFEISFLWNMQSY